MSLSKLVALALAGLLVAPSLAEAKKAKHDDDEETSDDDSGDDDKPAKKSKAKAAKKSDDEDADDDDKPAKKAKAKPAAKKSDDDDEDTATDDDSSDQDDADEDDDTPKKKKKKSSSEDDDGADVESDATEKPVKQDLSGHDLGTTKKKNEFEQDRFYVDKLDSEKTEKGTLIQGSLQSTSFLYKESGGKYGNIGGVDQGYNNARFARLYTEMRLQTDFRHIAASDWDARIDARARLVNPADNSRPMNSVLTGNSGADTNHPQSGFNGENEYDIRELWLYRSGKRTDFFFGRQFIPDLGGIKFDGLRFDYAKSKTFTLIGFGGTYPLRGSRSITSDYPMLRTDDGMSAGRWVGSGGFGAAYRTLNAYGAFGGVILQPIDGSSGRGYATSTGYYRYGSQIDLYHFALVDAYGTQGSGLTNLSAGLNYKPSQRLRLTAAFNRVDVDTLGVQANAFLNSPNGSTAIENETYFRRLATNTARGGISAALGELNRYEVSIDASYRERGSIDIPFTDTNNVTTKQTLQATKGAELHGSIVDRRSIKDMRLGVDVVRTLKLGDKGDPAFQRSVIFALRLFAARELANGHGEWEAEVAYTGSVDKSTGTTCIPDGTKPVSNCYGSSKGAIISAGGTLYYRINTDWMLIGSAYLTRQSLSSIGNGGMPVTYSDDPTITGITGFFRIAYRF